MSSDASTTTRLWRMLNRDRFRENQRDNYKRQRLRREGKLIPANSPADIARWWKDRGW